MKTLNPKHAIAFTFVLIACGLGGCTSMNSGANYRPIVDGGDLTNYDQDVAQCQELAKQREYLNDDSKGDFLLGALLGALAGSDGDRGDIIGGMIVGGAVGAGSSAYDARDERKNIVIKCMENRGYNTIESTNI